MRGVLIGTPSGAQIPLGQVARISFSRGPALIRDEDGALTGYIYIDLKDTNYGGFVTQANKLLHDKLNLPANYSFHWSGECELELRAKQRLQIILPIVFFVIFLLLYLVFHSVVEALVLIFPTIYAMSGGLLLQWLLEYNFSVAVAVGYIALFGIAVETGVVMVVYLHEALQKKLEQGRPLTNADIETAAIDFTVCVTVFEDSHPVCPVENTLDLPSAPKALPEVRGFRATSNSNRVLMNYNSNSRTFAEPMNEATQMTTAQAVGAASHPARGLLPCELAASPYRVGLIRS